MNLTIISGGQTGADRTGLEVAREHGFATGGFAPRGYRTEVGPDPSLADFGLLEHPHPSYPPRTYANVRASDFTVWFGKVGSPGYKCTKRAADTLKKGFVENPDVRLLCRLLASLNIRILNVAGNRASTNPAVCQQVRDVLGATLQQLKERHGQEENTK